jgi:hypothetical protein
MQGTPDAAWKAGARWISALVLAGSFARGQNPNVTAAYQELTSHVFANQTSFYVYQDQDSALNHGFPSGWFGYFSIQNQLSNYISLDTGCIDDPTQSNGCAVDTTKLDRTRGTVLRVTFAPLAAPLFAGVNIEEPENWGAQPFGNGYNLTGSTSLVFEARSPDSAQVQFGMGRCVAPFQTLSPQWQTCAHWGCEADASTEKASTQLSATPEIAAKRSTRLAETVKYSVLSGRSSGRSIPLSA